MDRLPAQRTREITWLAFSEDDTWLAVASFDGLAQVFDVATRDFVVSGEIWKLGGLSSPPFGH